VSADASIERSKNGFGTIERPTQHTWR